MFTPTTFYIVKFYLRFEVQPWNIGKLRALFREFCERKNCRSLGWFERGITRGTLKRRRRGKFGNSKVLI